MKGYIYKITSPSGKIYIGQTNDIIKRRNAYNSNHCKRQPKLYNSIKKYGWNNHTFEIIEEVSMEFNKFWLNLQEIYCIDFYNSFVNGLNCTLGGDGANHSDETKQKIKDNHGKSNKNNLITGLKKCSKCKEDKPLDDFGLDKKNIDGRRNPCKQCRQDERQIPEYKKKHAAYNKQYYADGYNEYHKKLYKTKLI